MNEEQRCAMKQNGHMSHNGYHLSNLNLNPVNVTPQKITQVYNNNVYNDTYENESDDLSKEKTIPAVFHTIPKREGQDEVFINTVMGSFMILVIAMMLWGLIATYLM